MKQFACGDVVPDCKATFTGRTDREVLDKVAAHAAEAHGITELDDELVEAVTARIR